MITIEADGKFTYQPPDLARIAENVGKLERENCGNCHFYWGGGDNVKHGDLSTALLDPNPHVDVHMSSEGGNMQCIDCHVSKARCWPGSRYPGTVKDVTPLRPGFRNTEVLACDTCHTDAPHDASLAGIKLNAHTDRIACAQTGRQPFGYIFWQQALLSFCGFVPSSGISPQASGDTI